MTKICGALLVLASLAAAPAAAQSAAPPIRYEWLDSNHAVISTATGAHYRRETEYADSVRGVVREFTLIGQLLSQSHFDNLRLHTLDGVSESWWPGGQLRMREEYARGKRVGELRLYYASGQLKRRAQYGSTGTSTGECFGPDGKPVPFFEYEIMPRYSRGDGGFVAIVQAISSNVKYPRDALKANVQGQVFIKFAVNKLGKVADIEVAKGVFPSLDQAAMQAVRELHAFTPGQQDGETVAVSFTVPITFRVQ